MKRLATTFLVGMAAVGWCATVRMGQLSTDTTVETLGESEAVVQLVSKAKIDSLVETLSVGTDDTWIELNGATGTIYQIVYSNCVHITSTSGVGEDGPLVGTVFDFVTWSNQFGFAEFGLGDPAPIMSFAPAPSYGSFVLTFKNGKSWRNQNSAYPVGRFYSKITEPASSILIEWLSKTNAYQIAITDDLPDLSGYATTGAVAAVQAAMPDTSAPTNWVTRTGLSGTVAFANDAGRPQAWTGTGALTVSGFTGLNPPVQVYWTLAGFDSVTLPAGVHVVGGGSWQTNMVNHFTLWQTGTNVLMSYITATED